MNVEGNLSNCISDICCLCCPTIGFCGISTGINELIVDGLLANIGIGIVPLFCSSSLAKDVPVPIARGTDSFSLCVCVDTFMDSLRRISGQTKCRKLITKNVFLESRLIPCVKHQSFVAAEQGTRTRNHRKLTGNVRQSSTII